MTFECVIANSDGSGEAWQESYNEPGCRTLDAAQKWAEKTIASFNETLRPGEKPRKLIKVREAGQPKPPAHQWGKVNLVTQLQRGRMFDLMRCRVCGVTAKRYGLNNIIRDRKYKAAKFEHCTEASA